MRSLSLSSGWVIDSCATHLNWNKMKTTKRKPTLGHVTVHADPNHTWRAGAAIILTVLYGLLDLT